LNDVSASQRERYELNDSNQNDGEIL